MTDPTDKTDTAETPLTPAAPFIGLLGGARVGDKLRSAGISPTLQRLAIAQVMFAAPVHLTADEALARVRDLMPEVSRATVYNTLKLFKTRGLVRDIIVPERVVFDSTTTPHHHFYNVDTGEVTDVPTGQIVLVGTATLPPDLELDDIDVVVRVRHKSASKSAPKNTD